MRGVFSPGNDPFCVPGAVYIIFHREENLYIANIKDCIIFQYKLSAITLNAVSI